MIQTDLDPAALVIIRRTPAVLRSLLEGLPEAVLLTPNDEGWSLKDIVAHVCDVEGGAMVERIQRMRTEDHPFIRSIDPPARLAAGGYAKRSLEDLLATLERARQEHADWLGSLTPADLARSGQHDEVGEIYVVDLVHQWAAHDLSHLRQIGVRLQQHLAPRMGATRAFYDV